MNLKKLKEAEQAFLSRYPGGFAHPEMQETAKKHKPEKMKALAQEFFARDEFINPGLVVEHMKTLLSRSSMVSVFEKPKFKDFATALSPDKKQQLSEGLKLFLYGNERKGFEQMVDVLAEGGLAKWAVLSVFFIYFRPDVEVFMKPTTVKNIISYLEISDLHYKPRPGYDFYQKYREIINTIKKKVDKSLSPDNAAFSGFLMMMTK